VAGRLGALRSGGGRRRSPLRQSRLGVDAWRRLGLGLLVVALLLVLPYQFLIRGSTVAPQIAPPRATATIGEGPDAVAVGPDGTILGWLPLSDELQLPALPISVPPRKGQLGGEVLEQALVLGAAPASLRPYIERSYYGESGVDVELRGGIELRFGDATRLGEKWKAAAGVLANPEITELGYVDLRAPRRPAVGGSGHTLPAVP
jgi:hypothetical protein